MNRTLVIAEPGCTHEGAWDALVRLLETAKACGADVFKPQWVSDPVQMCERRHITEDHPKRAYYEKAYRWLNFPVEWHKDLANLCGRLQMQYACTVFLPQDVATIAPWVDYLKVSGFESDSRDMHAACVGVRGLIVSAPASSELPWYECMLHCVQAYPAPMAAMNLAVLRPTCEGWGSEDLYVPSEYSGLSDHSRNVLTGAVAVAAGARVVETHFRLNDCDPNNPDYLVAFSPKEFAQYIRNIRDAEVMLGDGVKQVQECERWALPYRVTL